MNEFTKEELQIILLDMDTYFNTPALKLLTIPDHHLRLRDKIEIMIDHYGCEHKNTIICQEKNHRCTK